jgi:hypothetical protein
VPTLCSLVQTAVLASDPALYIYSSTIADTLCQTGGLYELQAALTQQLVQADFMAHARNVHKLSSEAVCDCAAGGQQRCY